MQRRATGHRARRAAHEPAEVGHIALEALHAVEACKRVCKQAARPAAAGLQPKPDKQAGPAVSCGVWAQAAERAAELGAAGECGDCTTWGAEGTQSS